MLRPVVVGLDGSSESLAAADWAAREALRRGLPLRLVHAWEGLSPEESELPELEAPRSWARQILRGAMDRLNERYPQVYLSAEQLARPAADALVTEGAEAELLVLGSRAFSGFGGFMGGSVALATVARVTRPVVLVRADQALEDEHVPDAEGRPSARTLYRDIVVGVDITHPCEEVLTFAFESAALRSAPLRVVHTWRLPYAPGAVDAKAGAAVQQAAERALASVLQPWREKYPTVEVRELVEKGRAAQQLLHAAQDAGRRIRPSRLGTHTGPVAHAVMHPVGGAQGRPVMFRAAGSAGGRAPRTPAVRCPGPAPSDVRRRPIPGGTRPAYAPRARRDRAVPSARSACGRAPPRPPTRHPGPRPERGARRWCRRRRGRRHRAPGRCPGHVSGRRHTTSRARRRCSARRPRSGRVGPTPVPVRVRWSRPAPRTTQRPRRSASARRAP
ncbi:universal stress protein [Streptomyces xiangluensis]|uniref:Universal stress protein n=1 Tax=Streptomyces xiangluensis TaxID=2665720 RepID=A0ABV8YG64_9ACTN